MSTFRHLLSETEEIVENINSDRESRFIRMCKSHRVERISGFSEINTQVTDTEYWCSVEDEENDRLYLDQTLTWSAKGVYELEVIAPQYKVSGVVNTFEYFNDALKVIDKNIAFIKKSTDAALLKGNIKTFS